jgi:hypothetical protein
MKPDLIVTAGDAKGVCDLAKELARELGIGLKTFCLEKKYAGGKYEKRSLHCLGSSDYVLLLHDGKSKGTMNELEMARGLGLKYKYIVLQEYEKNDAMPSYSFDSVINRLSAV